MSDLFIADGARKPGYARPQKVVGVAGRAGSGKDTFALGVRHLGYKRLAFADALKSMAWDVDPIIHSSVVPGTPRPLREVIQWLMTREGMTWGQAWDYLKRVDPEMRRFLQRLGQGVRDHVDINAWINPVYEQMVSDPEPEGFVVTDVRYENEIVSLLNLRLPSMDSDGDIMDSLSCAVRIKRPGETTTDTHSSETNLLNYPRWDFIIKNDGTESDLVATGMVVGGLLSVISAIDDRTLLVLEGGTVTLSAREIASFVLTDAIAVLMGWTSVDEAGRAEPYSPRSRDIIMNTIFTSRKGVDHG